MKVTYSIAMAAGRDAANRNMSKAGRSKWNREDYNIACDTVSALLRS